MKCSPWSAIGGKRSIEQIHLSDLTYPYFFKIPKPMSNAVKAIAALAAITNQKVPGFFARVIGHLVIKSVPETSC